MTGATVKCQNLSVSELIGVGLLDQGTPFPAICNPLPGLFPHGHRLFRLLHFHSRIYHIHFVHSFKSPPTFLTFGSCSMSDFTTTV